MPVEDIKKEVETENEETDSKEELGEEKFDEVDNTTNDPIKKEETKVEEEKPTEEKNKPEDLAKKNAEYAKIRREKEKAEKDAETIKQRAYLDGVKYAFGGVNPFTKEELKDDDDIQALIDMKAMEKEGLDPTSVKDYQKFIKDKVNQKIRQEDEEIKRKEYIAKDSADFIAKHGQAKLTELVNDPTFNTFVGNNVGKISLNKLYEMYQSLEKAILEKATKAKVNEKARTVSTPGATKVESDTKEYFTKEEVKRMSYDEVQKNLEKIEASQKRWRK